MAKITVISNARVCPREKERERGGGGGGENIGSTMLCLISTSLKFKVLAVDIRETEIDLLRQTRLENRGACKDFSLDLASY